MAQVAEDALAPALANRRVQSCLHVMDDVLRRGPLSPDAEAAAERVVFLCPMHPERLLCDARGIERAFRGCLISHYETHHAGEHRTASCFFCAAPLRDSFVLVDAEVQLHRPVSFYADGRGRDRCFVYRGTINVLPVAYLCPRHADWCSCRCGWLSPRAREMHGRRTYWANENGTVACSPYPQPRDQEGAGSCCRRDSGRSGCCA